MSSVLIVDLIDLHSCVKELNPLSDKVINEIDNCVIEEWFKYMKKNYCNDFFVSELKEEVLEIYKILSLETKIVIHEKKIDIEEGIDKKSLSEFNNLFELSEELSFILGENRDDFPEKIEIELGKLVSVSGIIIKVANKHVSDLRELIKKSGIKKQVYIVPSNFKTNNQIVFEYYMSGISS